MASYHTVRSLLTAAAGRLRPFNKRRNNSGSTHDQRLSEVSVRFQKQSLRLLVRAGTTDIDLVNMILREKIMYRLPQTVQPKVIFDIGANIGITTVYFSLLYPAARVYCFEPLPQNLDLLLQNTKTLGKRVHILPYGLSDKSGQFEYHMSDDPRSFGGGGFMQIGHNPLRTLSLPLRAVADALDELGLDRIDLFKIDTEGSELAILDSIPPEIRANAQAYVGELHGIGNWEICQTLAQSHAVGVHKRFDACCFPFIAVRKDLAAAAASVLRRAA